jgi:hypothetical protein
MSIAVVFQEDDVERRPPQWLKPSILNNEYDAL